MTSGRLDSKEISSDLCKMLLDIGVLAHYNSGINEKCNEKEQYLYSRQQRKDGR